MLLLLLVVRPGAVARHTCIPDLAVVKQVAFVVQCTLPVLLQFEHGGPSREQRSLRLRQVVHAGTPSASSEGLSSLQTLELMDVRTSGGKPVSIRWNGGRDDKRAGNVARSRIRSTVKSICAEADRRLLSP